MITRFLSAAALVVLVVLVPVASAAAELGGSGWWRTSPLVVAPEAPNTLVVQGGPQADQPQSYAAVEFSLADGESASWLRLTVAPGSTSTPGATLTVCPLTDSFAPADGGAMADAPGYACTTKASAAAIGDVYTFDVTSLAQNGKLALAVLPGAVSDRVVLAKPSDDALQTSVDEIDPGSDTSTSGDTGAGGDTTFDSGTSPGSDDGFGIPSTPSFPFGPLDLPVTEVPAAIASVTDEVAAPQSPTQEAPLALDPSSSTTRGDDSGMPVAPIAFVFLALLAAGLWATASRMAEQTGTA